MVNMHIFDVHNCHWIGTVSIEAYMRLSLYDLLLRRVFISENKTRILVDHLHE